MMAWTRTLYDAPRQVQNRLLNTEYDKRIIGILCAARLRQNEPVAQRISRPASRGANAGLVLCSAYGANLASEPWKGSRAKENCASRIWIGTSSQAFEDILELLESRSSSRNL